MHILMKNSARYKNCKAFSLGSFKCMQIGLFAISGYTCVKLLHAINCSFEFRTFKSHLHWASN